LNSISGISLEEQKKLSNVAVDAVFDSVSIATTYKEKLAKAGVIFCSISDAIQHYPNLVEKNRKYLDFLYEIVEQPNLFKSIKTRFSFFDIFKSFITSEIFQIFLCFINWFIFFFFLNF
jgi:hypothetical protein